MLNPTEAALESISERIARIMTQRHGVRVVVQGASPQFDFETETIFLPDISSAEHFFLGEILDGILDHECGHGVLTNVGALESIKEDRALFHIWNTLEDAWTEREFGKRYRGVAENLENLHRVFSRKTAERWCELDPHRQLMLDLGERWAGRDLPAECKLRPFNRILLAALRAEVEDGCCVSSTTEAIAVARRVYAKLKNLGDGKDLDKLSDLGAGCIPETGQELVQGCVSKMLEALAAPNSLDSVKVEALFGELVGRPRGEDLRFCDTEGPDEYRVFSTQWDFDREYTAGERWGLHKQYVQLRQSVAKYVGTMAAQLSLALLAEAENRWVGGALCGRKFDQRKIPLWFFGADDPRIYREKVLGEQWDTAVSLLWDCSGSMGPNTISTGKSAVARMAAIAFHEALLQANIMHEVLGFNTGAEVPRALEDAVQGAYRRGEDLSQYSRLADLDNRMVFVPFGSSDGSAICKINGGHANRDGECVLWAARRLAARTESRKILIVGSDGQPSGARYWDTERNFLRRTVQTVISAGIEVYAIGIQDESVQEYYPEWVAIDQVADLPRAVMARLVDTLLARKGARSVGRGGRGASV